MWKLFLLQTAVTFNKINLSLFIIISYFPFRNPLKSQNNMLLHKEML